MVLEKTLTEKFTQEREQAVEYLKLKLPDGGLTDDQFFEFCQLNENLKIERNAKGEIIIMALTGTKTGTRNFRLYIPFGIWNMQGEEKGEFSDSSGGFRLPNGATYSPDVAFVTKERWDNLTEEQQQKFAPICPDFIAELLSNPRDLRNLQSKMEEFMENGCRLGWLIDPFKKTTYVYRPKVEVEEVPFDQILYGGQVLEGLQLKMADWLKS
ncbi:MAG: Uma2 family endonuclease [Bacteroidota bacterium]